MPITPSILEKIGNPTGGGISEAFQLQNQGVRDRLENVGTRQQNTLRELQTTQAKNELADYAAETELRKLKRKTAEMQQKLEAKDASVDMLLATKSNPVRFDKTIERMRDTLGDDVVETFKGRSKELVQGSELWNQFHTLITNVQQERDLEKIRVTESEKAKATAAATGLKRGDTNWAGLNATFLQSTADARAASQYVQSTVDISDTLTEKYGYQGRSSEVSQMVMGAIQFNGNARYENEVDVTFGTDKVQLDHKTLEADIIASVQTNGMMPNHEAWAKIKHVGKKQGLTPQEALQQFMTFTPAQKQKIITGKAS